MATTITGNGPNLAKRVALDATAVNCTQITFPSWVRTASLSFYATDGTTADGGKITWSGTDGAAIGDDTMQIGSGGVYGWACTPGRSQRVEVIYIAALTNSAYAHLHLSADD